MAYTSTYTTGQVAGLPADIVGTGLVAVKSWIPLGVAVGVGLGLYKMASKTRKNIKSFSKSYKPVKKNNKRPFGFYI